MIICWLFCRIAVWRVHRNREILRVFFRGSQERAKPMFTKKWGESESQTFVIHSHHSHMAFMALHAPKLPWKTGFEASDGYQGCFEDLERHLRATVWTVWTVWSEVSFYQSACDLWCPKRISWNNKAKYLKTTNFMFGWLLRYSFPSQAYGFTRW